VTVACAGTGIASGVDTAIGDIFRLSRGPLCVAPGRVETTEIEAEVARFEEAVAAAAAQLRGVRGQIPHDAPSDIVDFIDTHLLMIEDRALSSQPITLIRQQCFTAEWALQQHRDALIQVFDRMDDAYLRTRRDDLDHVVDRVLDILLEQQAPVPTELRGRIVVAEDLAPADVILMHSEGIAGFVTDYGGSTSHTAILARSLGIPAVIGTRSATRCLEHGEPAIVDARSGVVLVDLDASILEYFATRQRTEGSRLLALRQRGDREALTRDHRHIHLLANIELPHDVEAARANGAEGIGLYRTEFEYMNRAAPPDEEELFAAYHFVVDGMGGRPVTIRTLDLGADKQPGGMASGGHGGVRNPALGLRAIRLCLKEPELFLPQLRAILRASAFGPVQIMLPMLTSVREIAQTRQLLRQAMAELDARGQGYDPAIVLGGMIEVPAAALNVGALAHQLDFLSIGTNDLIQYTLAIDRIDDDVNYLYDPAHPAVLRLLRGIIQGAAASGTPVGMCGEMAGDPRFIPLLLGLGLQRLSMLPAALLDVRELIDQLDAGDLSARVDELFARLDDSEPAALLDELDLLD
jgi:phosphoenolpyruvate-protein phosphotransferase (PTS system enzyme I)